MAELKIELVDENALLYYHEKLKAALAKKVDTKTGYSLVEDTEIARLKTLTNYDDSTVQSTLTDYGDRIEALEGSTGTDEETLGTLQTDVESLKTHVSDTTVHITAAERTKWNAAQANTIETIKVNGAEQTPDDAKAVDIKVPKDNKDLTNGAGYQTAAEVTAAINSAVGGISGFTVHKCEKGEYDAETGLPTLEGASGTFYLVPKTGSGANNVYTEFIYEGESFEEIGDTSMDLSNYVTKDDIITNESIDSMWAEPSS